MRPPLHALVKTLATAVVAALLVGSATVPARSAVTWTVYDRTTYTNADLVAAGATRAALVTNASWGSLLASGGLPDRTQFENLVAAAAANSAPSGPVVLDFETIYLRGSITRAVAESRRTQWITLLDWAHHAAPGRMIGSYNFLHELDPAFLDLAVEVAAHEDAFFPAMYTYINNTNNCSDQAGWTARLTAMVDRGDQIDPAQPTIPVIWPQIYPTCPGGGGFVPAAQWRWQLDSILGADVSGLLIYSGSSAGAASDLGWYDETADFIDSL